jgi:undecaprenyl-diphosphatase
VTVLDEKPQPVQDQRNPVTVRLGEGITASLGWLRRKPRPALAEQQWAGREQWLALILLAFGAALVSMFLVDVRASLYVRLLPQLFVDAVNRFTDFGKSTWTLWPSGIVLLGCLFIGARRTLDTMQHRVLAAIAVRAEFIFVAIAVPGLFVGVVKRIIGRGRPLAADHTLHASLPDAFYYLPFSGKADFTAMPSGHATAAFSALVVLGSLWPKARPYLWIYAVAIALSRVILLSHFVSDVIMGALVGSLGAILVRNAFTARGLVFFRDESGQTKAKPGPSWRRIKALARAVRGQ